MVLRIYFTPEDLCRVRVANGPHPLWELVLSINSLQQDNLPPRYWGWQKVLGARGRSEPGEARLLRAACWVVPKAGNFADFLTPSIADLNSQAHFESMLALPKSAVRADLDRTFQRMGDPPPWARRLYDHGNTSGLVRVLNEYRTIALEPIWDDVHRQVELAREQCAKSLLSSGVDGLLHGLHPSIHWRHPVLEAPYPVDRDLRLSGRGLLIVPTYFNFDGPVTFIDRDKPPTLVCPANRQEPPGTPAAIPGDTLANLGNLIGHTRATLLAALTIPTSTHALATRLQVTPAAISQHTKALREAGLLTTTRTGQSVRHALTPTGTSLLRGHT